MDNLNSMVYQRKRLKYAALLLSVKYRDFRMTTREIKVADEESVIKIVKG